MTKKFAWNPGAVEFVPLPYVVLDGSIAVAFEEFQRMNPEYCKITKALEQLAAEICDLDDEFECDYDYEECPQE